MLKSLLGAGVLMLAWVGTAQAAAIGGDGGGGGGGGGGGSPGSTPPGTTVSAPEIDPASAASGLSLLVGGVLVLRGRKPIRTEI